LEDGGGPSSTKEAHLTDWFLPGAVSQTKTTYDVNIKKVLKKNPKMTQKNKKNGKRRKKIRSSVEKGSPSTGQGVLETIDEIMRSHFSKNQVAPREPNRTVQQTQLNEDGTKKPKKKI